MIAARYSLCIMHVGLCAAVWTKNSVSMETKGKTSLFLCSEAHLGREPTVPSRQKRNCSTIAAYMTAPRGTALHSMTHNIASSIVLFRRSASAGANAVQPCHQHC